jgi:hypothetical protein
MKWSAGPFSAGAGSASPTATAATAPNAKIAFNTFVLLEFQVGN